MKQNIQEIWDSVESPSLRIIGMEEEEETQVEVIENAFSKVLEDKFSNLQKEMC